MDIGDVQKISRSPSRQLALLLGLPRFTPRKLRLLRGPFTQKALSAKTTIPLATIRAWEQGRSFPSLNNLRLLLEHFGGWVQLTRLLPQVRALTAPRPRVPSAPPRRPPRQAKTTPGTSAAPPPTGAKSDAP